MPILKMGGFSVLFTQLRAISLRVISVQGICLGRGGGDELHVKNYFGMADGRAASKVSRIIQKCRDGGVEDLHND